MMFLSYYIANNIQRKKITSQLKYESIHKLIKVKQINKY